MENEVNKPTTENVVPAILDEPPKKHDVTELPLPENAPTQPSSTKRMQLTPRRHEMLSCYLLGAGTLFMYLGYVTQAFISESVIHTIHDRDNDRISQFAGYYGQAFHYSAFAVSSLVTPTLQAYISSKWILTAASALFAVYYLGFFHITSFYFYFSQILMGVGYSLYNNGEGAYLSEHSSRRTIESNTGIETAIGHSSMFIGGIALMVIFHVTAAPVLPLAPGQNATIAPVTSKTFSDQQIHMIYGSLFALNVISVVIFAFLPTKQYDSIASKASSVIPSFKTQLKQLGQAVYATNMLILAPFFLYMGLIVSFLMAIFPTTLAFTNIFASDVYIVAIYSIGMGAAEIIGGVFVRPLIKRLAKWGLVFSMILHFICIASAITVCAMTVPIQSTIEPTSQPALLIAPSRLTVVVISLLIGMGDFSITMARAVICQVAVPESRAEVFSLSRLWQCVSSCIILVLSPSMNLVHWLVILAVFLVIGTVCFITVVIRTNRAQSVGPTDMQAEEKEVVESV